MRKRVALGVIVLFSMIGVFAQDRGELLRCGFTESQIDEYNSIKILDPQIVRYTASNPANPWDSKQDAAEKASKRHYVYEGSIVIANKGKVDRTVITNLDRMRWSMNPERMAITFQSIPWLHRSHVDKNIHIIPCEHDLKPATLRPGEAVIAKFKIETMQVLDETYIGYSLFRNYKERFGYWCSEVGSVKSDKVKIMIYE